MPSLFQNGLQQGNSARHQSTFTVHFAPGSIEAKGTNFAPGDASQQVPNYTLNYDVHFA